MDTEKILIGGLTMLLIAIGTAIIIYWARLDTQLDGCEDVVQLLQHAERLEGLRMCPESEITNK